MNYTETKPDGTTKVITEPTIGIKGRAYTSMLDGNAFLKVGEHTIFDLTEQDAHDVVAAITQMFANKARERAECKHLRVDSCSTGARWCHDCQIDLP